MIDLHPLPLELCDAIILKQNGQQKFKSLCFQSLYCNIFLERDSWILLVLLVSWVKIKRIFDVLNVKVEWMHKIAYITKYESGIRYRGGERIPYWPVTPAASPISRLDEHNNLQSNSACQERTSNWYRTQKTAFGLMQGYTAKLDCYSVR
jgi:hypothetical protein